MPSATTSMPSAWASDDDRLDDRQIGAARAAVGQGAQADDERAVDLDRVEGQVAQVRERRVAGPEVVEDQPDAQSAQSPQPPMPASVSSMTTAP